MFSKYISFETIQKADFNYHEPSFLVNKDGRRFRVYHAKFLLIPTGR